VENVKGAEEAECDPLSQFYTIFDTFLPESTVIPEPTVQAADSSGPGATSLQRLRPPRRLLSPQGLKWQPGWQLSTARIALPVLGEGELDGGQGVTGFEGADFGFADSVKLLEGQSASAAVGGEIGRESGDALEEVLCSGSEIEGHRLL
jgi:hypothetical protein